MLEGTEEGKVSGSGDGGAHEAWREVGGGWKEKVESRKKGELEPSEAGQWVASEQR